MKYLKYGLITLLIAPLMAGYLFVAKADSAKAQSSLSDLIVLNGLFGTGGLDGSGNARNLAGLIAVDRTTGGGGGGTTPLSDLIVLNGLFGTGGLDSFGSARNLAGLIAVDRITGVR